MRTATFEAADRGGVMTRVDGKVSFPDKFGVQPEPGDTYEIVSVKTTPRVNFLTLGRKVTESVIIRFVVNAVFADRNLLWKDRAGRECFSVSGPIEQVSVFSEWELEEFPHGACKLLREIRSPEQVIAADNLDYLGMSAEEYNRRFQAIYDEYGIFPQDRIHLLRLDEFARRQTCCRKEKDQDHYMRVRAQDRLWFYQRDWLAVSDGVHTVSYKSIWCKPGVSKEQMEEYNRQFRAKESSGSDDDYLSWFNADSSN